jgi:uncharacterized membrane protein YbaN (DUF454 family)
VNKNLQSSELPPSKTSHKVIRILFNLAGTIFLGLGILGVVIPLLPTTPFLLLALSCYYKGSRRLHYSILNNKWFGKYFRNYKEGKGISITHKIISILFLWATISFSILFVSILFYVKVILVVIAVLVTIHIARIPALQSV